jgi:hypothetical protein
MQALGALEFVENFQARAAGDGFEKALFQGMIRLELREGNGTTENTEGTEKFKYGVSCLSPRSPCSPWFKLILNRDRSEMAEGVDDAEAAGALGNVAAGFEHGAFHGFDRQFAGQAVKWAKRPSSMGRSL